MALYLVQHGKSIPREKDPEQGLSPEGIADVNRIAETARMYGVRPALIRHSGKKRAAQSAEIFAGALLPGKEVERTDGIGPLDDVTVVAKSLKSEDNLMLVGHLPFMERLVGLLVAGSPERLVFKFQNGGIVCLEQIPGGASWFIKWTLMPEIA